MPETRLKWHRRWGGRYRSKYVAGPYTIEWVGATHGVWTLRVNGGEAQAHGLLKDAQAAAARHYDKETKDAVDRSGL